MSRALTNDDVEIIYEACAKFAVNEFNEHKELAPNMTGLALGSGPGEVKSSCPMPDNLMRILFSSPEAKHKVRPMIMQMLEPGSMLREALPKFGIDAPDVVVMMNEGWMLMTNADPEAA